MVSRDLYFWLEIGFEVFDGAYFFFDIIDQVNTFVGVRERDPTMLRGGVRVLNSIYYYLVFFCIMQSLTLFFIINFLYFFTINFLYLLTTVFTISYLQNLYQHYYHLKTNIKFLNQLLNYESVQSTINKNIQILRDHKIVKMANMYKTALNLKKQIQKNHIKSLNNFVLLNSERQIKQNYQWQRLKASTLLQRSNSLKQHLRDRNSYSNKKSILTNLKQNLKQTQYTQKKQQSINTFMKSKIGFKLDQQLQTQRRYGTAQRHSDFQKMARFTTTNHFNTKGFQPQRKFNQTTTNFNKLSIKSSQQGNKFHTVTQKLHNQIQKAMQSDKRVISVVSICRYGLRIRLNHGYFTICTCENSKHNSHKLDQISELSSISNQILSKKSKASNKMYYFNQNQQPIFNTQQISEQAYIIIASQSPKLNIDQQFRTRLNQETQKISNQIRNIQNKYNQSFKDQSRKFKSLKKVSNNLQNQQDLTKYDWQTITNINDYVRKLCQNPNILKLNPQIKINPSTSKLQNWCNQKFVSNEHENKTKKSSKNPLLQDQNHYPKQTLDKQCLALVSERIQQCEFIKNTHMIPNLSNLNNDQINQLLKQQSKKQQLLIQNHLYQNILKIQSSKSSILSNLTSKHSLLSQQNIPYLMLKYGITRYQIHNLFTLYKTLQKVSAMRNLHISKKIISKGIDRESFDQAMKKLDINPGDQVVRNICLIGDFINWEDFIKIISIGLRKTNKEKFDAILAGIGGINQGFLTKKHISIMIGSSLNKIFDSEQPQLKQYFTQVVMKDLDSDGNGTIEIEELKDKIIHMDPQNIDIVAFLILNS